MYPLGFLKVPELQAAERPSSYLWVLEKGVLVVQAATSTPLLRIPRPKLQALDPTPPAAEARCVHALANDDVCEVGAEVPKAHPDRQTDRRREQVSYVEKANGCLAPAFHSF